MKETTDHAEIQGWAERLDGRPQIYDNPAAGADRVGIRIDFPGSRDDDFPPGPNRPRNTSWDEFFQIFERQQLSFLYEEEGDAADRSSLYRFERRSRIEL